MNFTSPFEFVKINIQLLLIDSLMFSYFITPDPLRHRYSVRLRLAAGRTPELILAMAAWTPGSYVIREYAGRICELSARAGNRPLVVTQTAKSEWHVNLAGIRPEEQIDVSWSVFSYSLGVHDAWIDSDRGFINPAALFLYPGTDGPATVDFDAPGWNVFCSLAPIPGTAGRWQASSIDELLDAPWVLVPASGRKVHVLRMTVAGVPHEIVITGTSFINRERLERDFRRIFEETIRFWDPVGESAPFNRYLVSLHVASGLYGGLEHSAGAALLEDPGCLPAEAEDGRPSAGYAGLLSLVAHEYFHAWLVKRLKPEGFLPYDLSQESPSHDLWIFEGITSYYESLLPLRAGVIDEAECLHRMTERLNAALTREGFDRMTLAESGFNAWTKLYRPSQDSFYSQVSYYTKGALAALIIDHELCTRSEGTVSLENFLVAWFAQTRTDIASNRWKGLPDEGIGAVILELTGIDLRNLIDRLVHGKNDRSWWSASVEAALQARGFAVVPAPDVPASLRLAGLRWTARNDSVVAGTVLSGSPAFSAGLFAGDEIIAVDGERSTRENIERQIELAARRCITVHYFRDSRLLSGPLDLTVPLNPACEALLPARIVPVESQD